MVHRHRALPAEISSLFVTWSVTGFMLDVPFGVLADRLSRRFLVAAAHLCVAAGFALWTFAPSYLSFEVELVAREWEARRGR